MGKNMKQEVGRNFSAAFTAAHRFLFLQEINAPHLVVSLENCNTCFSGALIR